MILQFVILSLVLFFSPLVPPILSPLGYSLTGVLLLQKVDPWFLSFFTIGVVVLVNIIIWILQDYIIKRIIVQKKTDYKHTGIFARVLKKFDYYFNDNPKIATLGAKRQKYAETKRGKFVTFLFAVFCFLPTIPDIVSNRILYKKIKFPYYLLAVIIGKTISHAGFIFLGKGVLSLFGF